MLELEFGQWLPIVTGSDRFFGLNWTCDPCHHRLAFRGTEMDWGYQLISNIKYVQCILIIIFVYKLSTEIAGSSWSFWWANSASASVLNDPDPSNGEAPRKMFEILTSSHFVQWTTISLVNVGYIHMKSSLLLAESPFFPVNSYHSFVLFFGDPQTLRSQRSSVRDAMGPTSSPKFVRGFGKCRVSRGPRLQEGLFNWANRC